MPRETLHLMKKDAATWLGVSRQTLSGYLTEGKIEPHSLIGRGRHARSRYWSRHDRSSQKFGSRPNDPSKSKS